MAHFFLFYAGKSSDYAEDAEVSKLCGSASPHPVRCPVYGGQFTLSTQSVKPNYLVILPPTQHHSFFRNLPPLCLNLSHTQGDQLAIITLGTVFTKSTGLEGGEYMYIQ